MSLLLYYNSYISAAIAPLSSSASSLGYHMSACFQRCQPLLSGTSSYCVTVTFGEVLWFIPGRFDFTFFFEKFLKFRVFKTNSSGPNVRVLQFLFILICCCLTLINPFAGMLTHKRSSISTENFLRVTFGNFMRFFFFFVSLCLCRSCTIYCDCFGVFHMIQCFVAANYTLVLLFL